VLIGGFFTFIDAPLVKYRRHGLNITFDLERVHARTPLTLGELQEKRRIELDRMIAVYNNFSTDAARAMQHGLVRPQEYPEVQSRIQIERSRLELRRELLVRRFSGRWAAFCRLYCSTVRPRELFTQLPHLLPKPFYQAGVNALNKLRR
jgi:hypothetical protein